MMRPMCGSSSATRTRRGARAETRAEASSGAGPAASSGCGAVIGGSDQRGDVGAVATELEQELADVGRWANEHEEHGLGGERRDDGDSLRVLEHCGGRGASSSRGAELVG